MFEDEFLTFGKRKYIKVKHLIKLVWNESEDKAYLEDIVHGSKVTYSISINTEKKLLVLLQVKEIAWLESSIPSSKDTPELTELNEKSN